MEAPERLVISEDDYKSLNLSKIEREEKADMQFRIKRANCEERSAPQDQLYLHSIVSPSTQTRTFKSDAHLNIQPIVSPPFSIKSQSSTGMPFDPTDETVINVSDLLFVVKQEIKDIYQCLSENDDVENSVISSKADEATLVHMMKTNEVLMTTLNKTFLHAKCLQEENTLLRNQLHCTNSKCTQDSHQDRVQNALKNLDTSDNYVQRTYPEVMKSPGTMFATEFAETMTLDVGEYTYLASIMDQQWKY